MIFVFGSNLAGRHGKGAALYAARKHGAEYGVGKGRTGNAYAIPTKDERLRTLSTDQVSEYIKEFCKYAAENHSEQFELTPVGCGLAGLDPRWVSQTFQKYGLTSNVYLSRSWLEYVGS